MKPIDILEYLPRVAMTEHMRGDVVYFPGNRSLHLVVNGIVKVSRQTSRGTLLVDLYGADEIFGMDTSDRESAHAFTDLLAMSWTFERIEQLCMEKPEIGIALLRLFAVRRAGFVDRIESLAFLTIKERLAQALTRFADRLGEPQDPGQLLPPVTHELLAEYIGATREQVTKFMNEFRRNGDVRSIPGKGHRRSIVVMGSLESSRAPKEVAA